MVARRAWLRFVHQKLVLLSCRSGFHIRKTVALFTYKHTSTTVQMHQKKFRYKQMVSILALHLCVHPNRQKLISGKKIDSKSKIKGRPMHSRQSKECRIFKTSEFSHLEWDRANWSSRINKDRTLKVNLESAFDLKTVHRRIVDAIAKWLENRKHKVNGFFYQCQIKIM